jgi:hypothetical protein
MLSPMSNTQALYDMINVSLPIHAGLKIKNGSGSIWLGKS